MARKLTPKQERFALNLFKGLSQRQAYIQAGYSSKSNGHILDENAYKLANANVILMRLNKLQSGVRSAAIMDKQKRQERLTVVAETEFKAPVTAKELVLAVAELNKMDHIYDDKPQYQDNRTYNILVQNTETKEEFNKLLEGKRPEVIEEGEK